MSEGTRDSNAELWSPLIPTCLPVADYPKILFGLVTPSLSLRALSPTRAESDRTREKTSGWKSPRRGKYDNICQSIFTNHRSGLAILK